MTHAHAYRITRVRCHLGTDCCHPEPVYADRPIGLADLIDEMLSMGPLANVATDRTGWTGKRSIASPAELDADSMIESDVRGGHDEEGLYREYLTICDGDGKPLTPRELFALLVLGEVVLL